MLWIRPGISPSNPEFPPFGCGYDPEFPPFEPGKALSSAGFSLLKTVLRKNDLKNGAAHACRNGETSQPYGYPRAGALGWLTRLWRSRAGQAPHPENARPRPDLARLDVPARWPARGQPLPGSVAIQPGQTPWGAAPHPAARRVAAGQALKPRLPSSRKHGVTARRQAPSAALRAVSRAGA